MTKILNQNQKRLLKKKGQINWKDIDLFLQKTSRTFALTIVTLPPVLKKTITISYLFCRMADTLEDEENLSYEKKKHCLLLFNETLNESLTSNEGSDALKKKYDDFIAGLPQEWHNNENWEYFMTYYSLGVFNLAKKELSSSHKKIILKHILIMTEGMLKYSKKQGESPYIINNLRELDDYCYLVAGVIGQMLTDLFSNYSFFISKQKQATLNRYSVHFGLGLQMTNILKDIVQDKNRNICFLPKSLIESYETSSENFLNNPNTKSADLIYRELIIKNYQHLKKSFSYIIELPKLEPKVRLFCLWPLFMALETLVAIAQNKDKNKAIKISRKQVKKIVRYTSLSFFSNALLKMQFKKREKELTSFLYNTKK